jgi:hypothetical protein
VVVVCGILLLISDNPKVRLYCLAAGWASVLVDLICGPVRDPQYARLMEAVGELEYYKKNMPKLLREAARAADPEKAKDEIVAKVQKLGARLDELRREFEKDARHKTR